MAAYLSFCASELLMKVSGYLLGSIRGSHERFDDDLMVMKHSLKFYLYHHAVEFSNL